MKVQVTPSSVPCCCFLIVIGQCQSSPLLQWWHDAAAAAAQPESGWLLWGAGQWHDSTSWHTLAWSGPGPVADAGPRVRGSAPVPGGQPLFLCSPGIHCVHAMLAMLLGLRGCTAIRLMAAAAVAVAGLSQWVGWKQWEMGKKYQAQARLCPACPDTPTPPPPHPHTPTPALRMQPHWQESWPAGQALCPASPEPTFGWAAGGFYSASGSWIGYPQCLWSKGGPLLDEEWAMVLASRTEKLPSISKAFLSCWLAILHLRALRAYVCLASGDGAAVPSGCWWHTLRGLNQVFVSASYQLPDRLGLRLGQDAYGVHVSAMVARFHAAWTDPASLLGAGSHGIAMLHGCMQLLCLAVVVRPAVNVLVINM